MTVNGSILIGRDEVRAERFFRAPPADNGDVTEPAFFESDARHVDRACALAEQAFDTYRETPAETRACFLEAIADRIADLGDAVVERAMAETRLPRARLVGEVGRTAGQLRLFAGVVREGTWMRVAIDPALPDRVPLPRPDLRLRNVAIGPVAVFGASNFPLAFSVAGGDTAAALAAGCPVVVKGHPAHPGTGEMIARAILKAADDCGMPEGVFSLLPGTSHALGAALVADPRIQAVGFTGSRGGGLALMAIAQSRSQPIPVFAEMSSVNPVLLFPAALADRAEIIAEGFVSSLTLGSGQFCTNPGLVLAIGEAADRFLSAAASAFTAAPPPGPMLTRDIADRFSKDVEQLMRHPALTLVARGRSVGEQSGREGALFVTDASSFLGDPTLSHEVFGVSSIVIRCLTIADARRVVEQLEGQLTITLHLSERDFRDVLPLIPLLERKAGRILANGWPTGVEVSRAMVHGGPFPATSDGRSTSVGSRAIDRFLRPVSYQDMPFALLPVTLRNAAAPDSIVAGAV